MYTNKSKIAVIIGFFIVAIGLVILMVSLIIKANRPTPIPEPNLTEIELNESLREYNKQLFDYKMVRKTNNYYNSNYLISPLSLAYMLKILEDGASGETRDQIVNLTKNYNLPAIVNIDKKISIANALFVNTTYKGQVNPNYINLVEYNYNANIMYDSFNNADGINNWVNGKTFGMIPRALNSINRNAVLTIVNTIALDIDWKQKMSSKNTHKATFNKIDKTQIEVAMMRDENAFGYLENENATGIVKHYATYDTSTGTYATNETINKLELEYIAIMPKTNLNDYINSFNQYELSKLLQTVKASNSTTDLIMNIPKYTYSFDLDKIMQIMIENNISLAFSPDADFSQIIPNASISLSEVIHKTYIDFGEEGTRAAAVSLATFSDSATASDKEVIKIDFDKPFLFLIKEKNSTNLWFFGVVYEPTSWEEYNKLIEAAQKEAERKKRGY